MVKHRSPPTCSFLVAEEHGNEEDIGLEDLFQNRNRKLEYDWIPDETSLRLATPGDKPLQYKLLLYDSPHGPA